MKHRADNRIAGFSLIEVIVGIAVLGLVIVPLCASLVLSVRINTHSRDLMNAQLAAAGMVETLMESGIDTGSGSGGLFTNNDAGEGYVIGQSRLPEGVSGVLVVQAKDADDHLLPWYHVTVVGESNGQTVELTTSIRKDGGT